MIRRSNARRAYRIYGEFTPEEREEWKRAVAEVEAEKEEIIALAKKLKAEHESVMAKIRETVAALKVEREKQGMSYAAIQEASGLDQAELECLETDVPWDVLLSALIRYADALGKNLSITLADK
jgi:hypothetical protein